MKNILLKLNFRLQHQHVSSLDWLIWFNFFWLWTGIGFKAKKKKCFTDWNHHFVLFCFRWWIMVLQAKNNQPKKLLVSFIHHNDWLNQNIICQDEKFHLLRNERKKTKKIISSTLISLSCISNRYISNDWAVLVFLFILLISAVIIIIAINKRKFDKC